jgi:hypothetical protein
MKDDIIVAIKCVPEESVLDVASEASFDAVELYTNQDKYDF